MSRAVAPVKHFYNSESAAAACGISRRQFLRDAKESGVKAIRIGPRNDFFLPADIEKVRRDRELKGRSTAEALA